METSSHSYRDGLREPTPDERPPRAIPAPRESPFFIVGAGRSGTTLLRLILAGHSRIEIPPETWFILPLARRFSLRGALAPEEVSEVVAIVTGDYRWPDMGIAADAFRDQVMSLANPRLVDIINVVYRHHLAIAGKPRLGDKTPPYIEIVPELGALYPGAKFIHLVRDGRDVAASMLEINRRNLQLRCYNHDFEWTRALRFRAAYRNSEIDRQILDVTYEDLVREPEVVIRRICAFLGEEFEPEMLAWAERVGRVPERERSIHPRLGQPLAAEAIERWRTKLSPFECFIMEACLRRDLRRWGYALRFSSLAWRPALVLCGGLLYCAAPLIVRGVPALRRRGLLPKIFAAEQPRPSAGGLARKRRFKIR